MRFFLLFFLIPLMTPQTGRGQRQSLITLLTDGGDLLVAKEIRKGREYWLYPSAVVESARLCSACPRKNHVILSIRFWQKQCLALARTSLRSQGLCQPSDPCRVGPFQAQSIVLRDSNNRWQPLTSSIPLAGILPETKRISILPTKRMATVINSSSVSSEALTAFHVSIVTASANRETRSSLTISGEDLMWAQRVAKIPDAKSAKLIDSASLRRLATWLLKAKMRDYGELTPQIAASQLASIERQLTVTSVTFRPDMKDLLAKGYRATSGEQLFVRRKIRPDEKISVIFDPLTSLNSVTMELTVAENFKFYSIPKTSSADSVDLLRRLDKEVVDIKKKLNESEHQRKMLEKEVTLLKKTVNVTTLYPNSLLKIQVEKLAMLSNSSHIMRKETLNLTAINDCYDIKRNKLKGGVYFLRSIKRPVVCTSDGALVVLRRSKGDVDFNVSWAQYEQGMGDPRTSDFFIGLKDLSALTKREDTCMTLLLSPWRLTTSVKEAHYSSFRIGPAQQNYRLFYEDYKGTVVLDALAVSKNQMFSTIDRDNDQFVGSCSKRFKSGNWHNSCFKSNIFGPYRNDASSGMCSVGLDKSQGDMCSPLSSVQMLLRRKANVVGSRRIVFSMIGKGSNCPAKLQIFQVPNTGLYRVTVGGAAGGFHQASLSQPGGRGAKLQGDFYFEKGTKLAASAGCRGEYRNGAGYGGDASWLVSRSKEALLAVAGGGGASGEKYGYSYYSGMHGRATADGGDSWWYAGNDSPNARSILLLDKFGKRAKGWLDLRERLLTASSGDFSSGGKVGSCYGGGGGGGYEGGIGCATTDYDAGGGGGSFCNTTEATSCQTMAGQNMRRNGHVIIERIICF